jgi:hypothetical protein
VGRAGAHALPDLRRAVALPGLHPTLPRSARGRTYWHNPRPRGAIGRGRSSR